MTALRPCPNPACCEAERIGTESVLTTSVLSYVLCRTCGTAGPRGEFERAEIEWNAMPRPADIVAARIEGLREGAKIAQAEFFMQKHDHGYLSSETPCWDDVVRSINARIAELEATAPEVKS